MWANKEVDLAPHPIVSLVLQVGDTEKSFLGQALGFESLDFFSPESASSVHVSKPYRRMEVTRDFYSLNLLAKLMVLHRQILFSLAIATIAEAILMRTSAGLYL